MRCASETLTPDPFYSRVVAPGVVMPRVRKITPPIDDAPIALPGGFPPITAADVAAWVGEASLRRAQPYVGDSLFDTRRSERTLKARCQGSAVQPYRVAVTFGERGIASDTCSCPVGSHCKHVAAVLLAWIDDPDLFTEVESTDVALERRDKTELIVLIRLMLARSPELETLLELPIPGTSKTPRSLDPPRIRSQVVAAFRAGDHGWDDWDDSSSAADELGPLVELGDQYAQAGDWRNAVIMYQSIAQGIADHYGEVEDDEALGYLVDRCVDGLAICLNNPTDSTQRESVLRGLFDIYRLDLELGGIGLGDKAEAVILDQATIEERRTIANWAHDIEPERAGSVSTWRSQQLGAFILELLGNDLDDETFLQLGHQYGLEHQIVGRLLTLGRYDEAESAVRQAADHQVLALADLLRTAGQTERAERAVREHGPPAHFQAQYTRWLRDRASERGDDGAALTLTKALFDMLKDPSLYDEVKALAEKLGRWSQLRPQIIGQLERDRRFALLTQIYLREGKIAEALASVRQTTERIAFNGESLLITVARAAEVSHPREAIALYHEAAEKFIAAQGRENYRSAAVLLARVRDLYSKLGERDVWQALIADIRSQHRRLRSLREELDRAKLG